MNNKTIAVIGAGSWGTAVAIHLAHCGNRVSLWGRNSERMMALERERCNPYFLADAPFPKTLSVTDNLPHALQKATHAIIATPSHAFHEILALIPQSFTGIAWLTKGLDPKSRQFLSQLVCQKWGNKFPYAVISGPSFASEVAHLMPTALVVASNNKNYSQQLTSLLHHNNIRVYQSSDPMGVQLCGAVKNVLAIACGISDGLKFGANAKAALITRGLAEMMRLGQALGALNETFMGLAGVGDLVLTCTDDQSRNRRFGLKLGQGLSIFDAEKSIGQVVEGIQNTALICALAKTKSVEMPICQTIKAILDANISAEKAAEQLMQRPPKP